MSYVSSKRKNESLHIDDQYIWIRILFQFEGSTQTWTRVCISLRVQMASHHPHEFFLSELMNHAVSWAQLSDTWQLLPSLQVFFGIGESQSKYAQESMASSDQASHDFLKVSISGPRKQGTECCGPRGITIHWSATLLDTSGGQVGDPWRKPMLRNILLNPDAITEEDMVLMCFSTIANRCERQIVSMSWCPWRRVLELMYVFKVRCLMGMRSGPNTDTISSHSSAVDHVKKMDAWSRQMRALDVWTDHWPSVAVWSWEVRKGRVFHQCVCASTWWENTNIDIWGSSNWILENTWWSDPSSPEQVPDDSVHGCQWKADTTLPWLGSTDSRIRDRRKNGPKMDMSCWSCWDRLNLWQPRRMEKSIVNVGLGPTPSGLHDHTSNWCRPLESDSRLPHVCRPFWISWHWSREYAHVQVGNRSNQRRKNRSDDDSIPISKLIYFKTSQEKKKSLQKTVIQIIGWSHRVLNIKSTSKNNDRNIISTRNIIQLDRNTHYVIRGTIDHVRLSKICGRKSDYCHTSILAHNKNDFKY